MGNLKIAVVGAIGLAIGAIAGLQIGQWSSSAETAGSQHVSTASSEDVEYLLNARVNRKLWEHIKRYNWAKIDGQLLTDADYQVFLNSLEALLNDDNPRIENYKIRGGNAQPVKITFGMRGYEMSFHIRTTSESGLEIVDPETETLLPESVLPHHKAGATENLLRVIQRSQTKEAQQDAAGQPATRYESELEGK